MNTDTASAMPLLAEDDAFIIKIAATNTENTAAQRLRYRVFSNLQQSTTTAGSALRLEYDRFDTICRQLIVIHKPSQRVVGTYRLQPAATAIKQLGLYAATEFAIQGLENITDKTVELGRSCVDPDFRHGAVIALLWQGIAQIMLRGNFRYLLGCVSFTPPEPAIVWAIYDYCRRHDLISTAITAAPQPDFLLPPPESSLSGEPLKKQLPPLFRGYLQLGGKICSQPALDTDFGTADFLMLLDLKNMPQRYFRHFNLQHHYLYNKSSGPDNSRQ